MGLLCGSAGGADRHRDSRGVRRSRSRDNGSLDILEEIAASGAAMNGCSAVHLSIFGMNPVSKHGSQEMKAQYLPRVASGELHVAFGVTEPDAGTDTTSDHDDGAPRGRRIPRTREKIWTSKAVLCEKVLLLVAPPRWSAARRTDGMTLLLADLQTPEVHIRAIPKLGRNAVVSCEVRYDDLFVAAPIVSARKERVFLPARRAPYPERILVASEALGIGNGRPARAVTTPSTESSGADRSESGRLPLGGGPRAAARCRVGDPGSEPALRRRA